MNKRILIGCVLALAGVWLALTMLGRKILPAAPLSTAWIVPLGAGGWEFVVTKMAAPGTSKEELIGMFGKPTDESLSIALHGTSYLNYVNPHDLDRDVTFAIGANGKMMYAEPGKAMRGTLD